MQNTIRKLLWLQSVILVAGTIFAWTEWALIFVTACSDCSLDGTDNPWTSKCLYGAIVFTLALIVHIGLFRKLKKN